MKISELQQLVSISRIIEIPIAVSGQTMKVSLGQIMDILNATIVPFDMITSGSELVTYANGSTQDPTVIVYDVTTQNFYAATYNTTTAGGFFVEMWTYYNEWETKSLYRNENQNVRNDCLFISSDGALYRFTEDGLISSGITNEQIKQLRLNTPMRVESEEEMERMIADGETVEGQLYYVPED